MQEIEEDKIRNDIFDEDESDIVSEVDTENQHIESSEIQVYSGEELNEVELYHMTSRKKTRIILVLGPVGSGKTTFEAMMYMQFLKNVDDDILFSGSRTLIGFEKIAKALKASSGESSVKEPRTPNNGQKGFLHLNLWNKKAGRTENIVLSNISGEVFQNCNSNVSNLENELDLISIADRILLFIDGEALINIRRRDNAINQTKMMIRTIKSSQKMFRSKMRIDIVISKNDLIYNAVSNQENIKIFIDSLESRFDEFQLDFTINFYWIEAMKYTKIVDKQKSKSLMDLLKVWVSEETINDYKENQIECLRNMKDGFNKYSERIINE